MALHRSQKGHPLTARERKQEGRVWPSLTSAENTVWGLKFLTALSLCRSVNNRKTTMGDDLGVTNKF